MTYNDMPNASGGDGMFPQHPKTGDWETLKGRTLAPHIAQPMESTAHTAVRFSPAPTMDWASSVIVNTGMTPGGGTMAAK